MLVRTILVSRPSVIMLRGQFGVGKSSVLNLLRLGIGKRAIVVPFNSWLPGSQETLVSDLFGDVALEIGLTYFVPGLRKRLRKLASVLAGTVPQLKGISEFLPSYTQRDEINDLERLLERIPRRVVVLLDEIDRMQKEEILTLLKVLRGAASLQNVTFVCALNQKQVVKTAYGQSDEDSNEAFEKFFPTIIEVPPTGPDVLKDLLRNRTKATFDGLSWFRNDEEAKGFRSRFELVWQKALVQACTNIRKVNLVSNDVAAAAPLVRGEVDALDLTALLALRRFYPEAYELIWRNASFFSQSDGWWKSRKFRSEEEAAAQSAQIDLEIKRIGGDSRESPVYSLLSQMFPASMRGLSSGARRGTAADDFDEAERGKRISHPDYFPIYFRYEVPDLIFSSLEMDRFVEGLDRAPNDAAREGVFVRRLDAFESNSVRRYDFIHKLALRMHTELSDRVALSVALAIARNADRFSDEFLVSEMRRSLAGVLAVAQRFSATDEVNAFLALCIGASSTDLFAAKLYRLMTIDRANNHVVRNYHAVSEAALRKAFADRMVARFGLNGTADVSEISMHAMLTWAEIGLSERSDELAFWTRYIGTSRARLGEAFNIIAPKGTVWTSESSAFIDGVIGRDVLARLDADLPDEPNSTPQQQEGLTRLGRFLRGEIRDGEILGERTQPNVIGEVPATDTNG